MSNKFKMKSEPKVEQALALSFVTDCEYHGPHIEFNTNQTSALLVLDLETVRCLREWASTVITNNGG